MDGIKETSPSGKVLTKAVLEGGMPFLHAFGHRRT